MHVSLKSDVSDDESVTNVPFLREDKVRAEEQHLLCLTVKWLFCPPHYTIMTNSLVAKIRLSTSFFLPEKAKVLTVFEVETRATI